MTAPAIDLQAHAGLVWREAWRIANRCRPLRDAEELAADGWLGLVAAAGRYDPARGAFSTFALPRIRGAILDGLRARVGRDSTPNKVAVERALDRATSIDAPIGIRGEAREPLSAILTDGRAADESLLEQDRAAAIARELRRLPEVERTVLAMAYADELPLRAIGHALGVSESRVSQIRRAALERLRTRLAGAL